MDYNKPLDLLHAAEETVWVKKVNTARVDGRICSWASAFHPEKLACRLDGGFLNGSYNVGQGIVFDDGATWFFRLPRASSISPEYANEKVAMEVEALFLIREKTTIPVPKIHAWGFAEENQLGLGPFILMDFIKGVCLNDVFGGGDSRLLKEEIPETDIEYVYRQMANFMLQLFKIDFNHIGNLPTRMTRFAAPSRPLTWKGHEILRVGGVNTLAQLFGSAPWWLLLDRPVNDEWDFEEGEAPKDTDRYFKCLEIFIRVLEEEETRMKESGRRELTELVRWSRDTGAMWLHMLLSSGFFDYLTFPCMQLRNHKGVQWWDKRMENHGDTEEVEKFIADKMKDLATYDGIKEKVEHHKVLMDDKEMSAEDFSFHFQRVLHSRS
ncbi:uncharacterized protein N7515_001480 [Penicillium bovifimosum]|uniref:Aminoglycoside phosphotransferase domain-containing protein n=1 Tax=Penicillium bovifimosum TaxID=126998 RepID=A0A9W9HA19_9EURO|nr:uncharacterized protein N7515_001480 [Penicillium bovifimosum]KAJ5142693.1 hypothetical protein N7515_001480 [Penicillium bovifimosum]